MTNPTLRDKIHHVPTGTYALVAQLDRVTDYESVGRGFESLLAYQLKNPGNQKVSGIFIFFGKQNEGSFPTAVCPKPYQKKRVTKVTTVKVP